MGVKSLMNRRLKAILTYAIFGILEAISLFGVNNLVIDQRYRKILKGLNRLDMAKQKEKYPGQPRR